MPLISCTFYLPARLLFSFGITTLSRRLRYHDANLCDAAPRDVAFTLCRLFRIKPLPYTIIERVNNRRATRGCGYAV